MSMVLFNSTPQSKKWLEINFFVFIAFPFRANPIKSSLCRHDKMIKIPSVFLPKIISDVPISCSRRFGYHL